MRILVLSFYYRPDLSAGSFRATALVEALRETVPEGAQIDVVTTRPNRYQSFTADAPAAERDAVVSVTRIPLGAHRSGVADQSRAFGSFARAVLAEVAGRRYDVVFATSSRLMTAALGAEVARRTGARLYLDIRDLFVDTIADVFRPPLVWGARPLSSAIERWTFRRADHLNLVSRGFESYVRARYPRLTLSFHTNGVDDEFLAVAPREAVAASRDARPVQVVYAGNVGEGQGLHTVLPPLARALGDRVHFRIVGDGGRLPQLRAALDAARVTTVDLSPPMPRAQLLAVYQQADVLFLHLNDYDAFLKVLPSKLFEYAALGKPIWAGVAGHAADFVRDEIPNAALFAPCDVAGAVRALDALDLGVTPRTAFLERFSRAQISRRMAQEIVALAARQDATAVASTSAVAHMTSTGEHR